MSRKSKETRQSIYRGKIMSISDKHNGHSLVEAYNQMMSRIKNTIENAIIGVVNFFMMLRFIAYFRLTKP